MVILTSVLLILNIQKYLSSSSFEPDMIIMIKEYKELQPKIDTQQKKLLKIEKESIKGHVTRKKEVNRQQIEPKQDIDVLSSEDIYLDLEDLYAESKAYNQKIDLVKYSEVVNTTTEFEKDVTMQLMEYMDPKE